MEFLVICISPPSWRAFSEATLAGSPTVPDTRLRRSEPKPASWKEQSMEKRRGGRYAMQSVEAADENQRRIEGVFAELEAAEPDSVSYIVLPLADCSLLPVSVAHHRAY